MTDKWDFYNIAYRKVCQNVLKEEPVKNHILLQLSNFIAKTFILIPLNNQRRKSKILLQVCWLDTVFLPDLITDTVLSISKGDELIQIVGICTLRATEQLSYGNPTKPKLY